HILSYIPHLNTDPILCPNLEDEEVFQRDFDNLVSSQIMLTYIGEASLGVGAEIVFAVKNNIRIITLVEKDKKVSRFVLGLLKKYHNHISICYFDMLDLEEKINLVFGQLHDQLTPSTAV
ncbi:hypothetical protein, partial [Flavobacterium sp.]